MNPHRPLRALAALCLPFLLAGCASAPVHVSDDKLEPSLTQATGLSTAEVETAKAKPSLGLWDAYALAAERTERLALKAEDVEQAGARQLEAVGAVLPHVSLQGTKGFQSDSTVPDTGTIGTNVPSTSLSLSGTQTLLTGLDEVAGLRGADADSRAKRHLLRHEAGRLLLDVARAFYSTLQLEETLQSKQASLDLTDKVMVQLKRWRAVGRTRESEVLSAEAQLARLEAETRALRNQLAQTRETLATLCGIPSDQVLEAGEGLPFPGEDLASAEAQVESRPDVLAAKAALEVSDAVLLQAQGRRLPSLSAQGNYVLLKEGGFPSPEWSLLLTAELPLFEGAQTEARVREAASKKRQAEMTLSQVRREALQEIRQAHRSLTNSSAEAEAYGKAQEASESEYRAVTADYRNSLTTNLEVLRTLDSLEDAKNNRARARFQALFDRVWWGVATGELPRTSDHDLHREAAKSTKKDIKE